MQTPDEIPPPGLRIDDARIDTRPTIELRPDSHETSSDMMAAIAADSRLYHYGGAIVTVERAADAPKAKRKIERVSLAGTPVIRKVPLSTMVDIVSANAQVGSWVARGKGQRAFERCVPPKERVRTLLETPAYWRPTDKHNGIRPLVAVVEAPCLRPDGTVLQRPGYDASTGLLYAQNQAFENIEERPTQSDAVAAYAHLAEVFQNVPFVNPSHLSSVVAAILTLFARHAIKGSVPAWLFDASAPRSGKSLCIDVVSTVFTGRSASRMTYPENDEELEKVLAGYALRGAPIINFDNVARPFGGAPLDKVITADGDVDLRVLGGTEVLTLAWIATIFASGNNVRARGDMLPRVLSPRLETAEDNPETRSDFAIARCTCCRGDLRLHVRNNRASLVRDALTILRAYIAAGAPDQHLARWGGFDSWARLIPHALVWTGAPDPMGARRGIGEDEDPVKVNRAAVIKHWPRLAQQAGGDTNAGVTATGAISVLYHARRPHEENEPPDGFDDLREAIEALTGGRKGYAPSGPALSNALRAMRGTPINGMKLVGEAKEGGMPRWRVVSSRG